MRSHALLIVLGGLCLASPSALAAPVWTAAIVRGRAAVGELGADRVGCRTRISITVRGRASRSDPAVAPH
jgi:hypothetical protein